jgi:hypothetical protein
MVQLLDFMFLIKVMGIFGFLSHAKQLGLRSIIYGVSLALALMFISTFGATVLLAGTRKKFSENKNSIMNGPSSDLGSTGILVLLVFLGIVVVFGSLIGWCKIHRCLSIAHKLLQNPFVLVNFLCPLLSKFLKCLGEFIRILVLPEITPQIRNSWALILPLILRLVMFKFQIQNLLFSVLNVWQVGIWPRTVWACGDANPILNMAIKPDGVSLKRSPN